MYMIIYFFPTYARAFMWQWRQKWHKMERFVISNFAICLFLVTDDTCDAYYIRVVRKK